MKFLLVNLQIKHFWVEVVSVKALHISPSILDSSKLCFTKIRSCPNITGEPYGCYIYSISHPLPVFPFLWQNLYSMVWKTECSQKVHCMVRKCLQIWIRLWFLISSCSIAFRSCSLDRAIWWETYWSSSFDYIILMSRQLT